MAYEVVMSWTARAGAKGVSDEAIKRGDVVWYAVNNNVGSRFLTQERVEQRGNWEVAKK